MARDISSTIIGMAGGRAPGKTICPSEVARALFPTDWRRHMDEVRDIAIALHQDGKIIITQKGKPVDADNIKGPIRISLK